MRTELQADCYSGVWAATVFKAGDLEQGDIEEAFNAAEAVGDDRLQRQAGQSVNPDSFTHGTSEQRRRWFDTGYRVRRSGELRHVLGRRGLSATRGPAAGDTIRAVGFFSRRRKRESAIPESANEQALGSFASAEGQPVVGQQVGGGQPSIDVQRHGRGWTASAALMQLGPMIQQAMASGNVQISQGEPQMIDMRGSELRRRDLRDHEPARDRPRAAPADQNVDASAYGDMQQQILEALAKHGIDPDASGSSVNFQIEPEDGRGQS